MCWTTYCILLKTLIAISKGFNLQKTNIDHIDEFITICLEFLLKKKQFCEELLHGMYGMGVPVFHCPLLISCPMLPSEEGLAL